MMLLSNSTNIFSYIHKPVLFPAICGAADAYIPFYSECSIRCMAGKISPEQVWCTASQYHAL